MVWNRVALVVVFALAMITSFSAESNNKIRYNFYGDKCPQAEQVVSSTMRKILSLSKNKNAPAQLLRLLFHDCFIEGCDASVLLTDNNGATPAERQAIPNKTLKGFQFVDMIKEELEKECPGVVSCSDILVLATRDGIVLSGGPYYPVFTGRRDSKKSFFSKASAEIPRPNGNISETLRLFSLRGFNERETVALFGAHNIGRIGCEFIRPRLSNFMGTGSPDSTIPTDLLEEMKQKCQETSSSVSSSPSSESAFGTHYFRSLVRGRGLLFADQQLMANEETTKVVLEYALNDGTAFRTDFARVMVKMSNLGVLTGSQGQVRHICSISPNSD